MDEKYNKIMQLSPYILAGWLLDGSPGPIQKEVLLEIRNDGMGVIRRAVAKESAGDDFLDLSLSPERVYVKGIPIPSLHLEWRRES
jgi:hypothetical protein